MRDIVSPIDGIRSPFGPSRLVPALYLPFAMTGFLDSRITFSRASQATMYDSTGKLTFAPNNLVTYSEQFDNAAWSKTNCTITANSITAPDGTNTADTLAGDGGGSMAFRQDTAVASANAAISFYVKAASATTCTISDVNIGSLAVFNLSTGVVVSGSGASIANVGNGWYRCAVVYAPVAGFARFTINPGATYVPTTTDSIYIWGAQLEAVTYETTPRTYVATTAAAYYGPRFDYNPSTLAARGLLIEEARTNVCTYSQQIFLPNWAVDNGSAVDPVMTANYGVSPDGTQNASRVVLDKTGGTFSRLRNNLSASSAAYTFSVWMKTTSGTGTSNVGIRVDSDGVNCVVTGSWQRFSVTTAAASTSPSAQVLLFDSIVGNDETADVLVWGAQVEAGFFASSYIPTDAAGVTRAADSATMTGTNFSSWYNSTQGTLFVQSTIKTSSEISYPTQAALTDGTGGNMILSYATNAGVPIQEIYTGSVRQFVASYATLSDGQTIKTAIAYETDNSQAAVNGTLSALDTSVSLPVVDRLEIGQYANVGKINSHIQSIIYYNTRLPDTKLQSITT